ncbi:MAG: TolC family protein, partial [Chthoniobacteraceae bacterium]
MLLVRSCLVVPLLALFFSPPDAGAKDKPFAMPAPVRTFTGNLSLDEAVKIALRQNPDLLNQLQVIEQTRGQIIEVRAEALPHLTLRSSYDQRAKDLFEQGSSSSRGGSSTNTFDTSQLDPTLQALLRSLGDSSGGSRLIQNKTWQVTLGVQQVLYSGGQVKAAIKIAKFAEDAAYYQLRDIIDTVIATVRTQYTTVLTNRALIPVAQESVQLQEDLLRDQKNRFEAGTVPRFNVLRAEVELANVQPVLIRARSNYVI